MFAVDHVLLSDDLLDAPFACDLRVCSGGCCVQGEAGAPLLEDECAAMEAVYPVVAPLMTPEARAVVAREGAWEETAPGHFNTACVPDKTGSGPCVFVTTERGVALCGIEKAFRAGKTDVQKPVSCHLYPLRIQNVGDMDVVNYEQIDLCEGGRTRGCRSAIQLADFLAEPLARRYGADWYARFRTALQERRDALGIGPQTAAIPALF